MVAAPVHVAVVAGLHDEQLAAEGGVEMLGVKVSAGGP